MAVRSVAGFPRTRRDSLGRWRGAVPGVPSRGCRGCARGRRETPAWMRTPGKVESTRRARSIRSRGAFSPTSPAQMGISRDGIARGDDWAPFIGCYQGSVEGIGWMRGWNGAHLDRQRVGKSGDWKVASAIIAQHQAASPSVGQRSAARCRAKLKTPSRIATSQEFRCLFMV